MTNTINKIMHNGTEYDFPWDVAWPASSTDGNLAVFDWATWKLIKDGWAVPVSFSATNGWVKVFDFPAVNDNITDILTWLSWWWSVILDNHWIRFLVTFHTTGYLTAINIYSSTCSKSIISYNTVTKVCTSVTSSNLDFFSPSWTATTWYVVTKTAWWYEWAAPSGWDVVVSSDADNVLTTWAGLRAWTETDYGNLGTYDSNTLYFTY